MVRLLVVVEHHMPFQSVQPNVCLPEGTQHHRHHQKYQNVDIVDQSAKAPSIGPPVTVGRQYKKRTESEKRAKDEKKRPNKVRIRSHATAWKTANLSCPVLSCPSITHRHPCRSRIIKRKRKRKRNPPYLSITTRKIEKPHLGWQQ